ncbi:hypothetical protein [Paraburkholderia azotifigens]|uniref:hypothetical protein n=1 Tax=Paraburkholderia azotifigens TaxID=2057004 RepID=UPI0038BAAA58
MPRLRPLELVSRSLGREWSLLPPNVSFRTELKALYAAMLRTFCLSADAIRTMCRWDPQSLRQQSAMTATPDAATPSTISLDMRHPTHSPIRESRQWNMLAGSACAIGGVAAIAWLMANHPRQPASPTLAAAPEVTLNPAANQAGTVRSRSGNIERPADAPLAWNRARSDLTARKPDGSRVINTSGSDAGHVSSKLTESASTETSTASASRVTTERASPVAPRTVDAYASVPPKSAKPSTIDNAARDMRKARSTKRERNDLASTSARRVPHAAARALDVAPRHALRASSEAPLSTGHRARHLPSVAGDYSPLAPSARLSGDYDSVTMSAGTHVRDIAPSTIRQDRVKTNSTEWMNHMSQRRVTEIPDSFSK